MRHRSQLPPAAGRVKCAGREGEASRDAPRCKGLNFISPFSVVVYKYACAKDCIHRRKFPPKSKLRAPQKNDANVCPSKKPQQISSWRVTRNHLATLSSTMLLIRESPIKCAGMYRCFCSLVSFFAEGFCFTINLTHSYTRGHLNIAFIAG